MSTQLSAFEISIREALALAQARRKSVGLKPLDTEVRKKKDGSRVVGPEKYKVTLFISPWHYADLIHFKTKKEITYGLNKMIENLIEDNIPHVAARPPKKAIVGKKKALEKINGGKAVGGTVTPIRKPSAYAAALAALSPPKKRASVG